MQPDHSYQEPDSLRATAMAALDNALRLVEDAELLLAAGRAASALALGTAALEEVGKQFLLNGAYAQSVAGQPVEPRLRSQLRSHEAKLAMALLVADMLSGAQDSSSQSRPARLFAAVDRVHTTRMRAMYVDMRSSDPLVPAREVSQEAARDWLAGVRGLVEATENVIGWARDERIRVDLTGVDIPSLNALDEEAVGAFAAQVRATFGVQDSRPLLGQDGMQEGQDRP